VPVLPQPVAAPAGPAAAPRQVGEDTGPQLCRLQRRADPGEPAELAGRAAHRSHGRGDDPQYGGDLLVDGAQARRALSRLQEAAGRVPRRDRSALRADRTGDVRAEAAVFVSSPGSVTPYHMDHEINFLL